MINLKSKYLGDSAPIVKDIRISPRHRSKLRKTLKKFYHFYPLETFTIFDMVRLFRKRISKKGNREDAWCAVVGETGSGKSLFAILCLILHGSRASLKKNITYIPEGSEIIEKFDSLENGILIVDEAAREMRAINVHSKEQQKVNMKAMTDRYRSNWVFMLMPNFNEFTKSMRIGNILFRFFVLYKKRNYVRVVLQRKDKNPRSLDPWGDKAANQIYTSYQQKKRTISNEIMLDIERSLPNYAMDFIVPNLEEILPDITNRYKELKIDSRRKLKDEEDKPIQKQAIYYKKKYENLLRRATKILKLNLLQLGKGMRVTLREMSEALGVSEPTFNKYLKEEVKERPMRGAKK